MLFKIAFRHLINLNILGIKWQEEGNSSAVKRIKKTLNRICLAFSLTSFQWDRLFLCTPFLYLLKVKASN